MPPAVTAKIAQEAARIYRLRDTHRACGGLLWGWDTNSRDYGLCDNQGLAQASLKGDESLICCVEGPPATVYTLAVTRFAPLSGQVPTNTPPPTVRFELLAGMGRASSLVLAVDWSPNEWLTGTEQSWIFQTTQRLAVSWWLVGRTTYAQDTGPETQIDVRLVIERGTPTILTPPQLGPGVVVAP